MHLLPYSPFIPVSLVEKTNEPCICLAGTLSGFKPCEVPMIVMRIYYSHFIYEGTEALKDNGADSGREEAQTHQTPKI